MKYSKAEIAEQAERFRKVVEAIPPNVHGTRRPVYTNVTHVSRSGMSRRMRFYVVGPDGALTSLTYTMAVLQGTCEDRRGFRIDGCGMDMGFAAFDHCMHVAYGRTLRADGKEHARAWQDSFRVEYL